MVLQKWHQMLSKSTNIGKLPAILHYCHISFFPYFIFQFLAPYALYTRWVNAPFSIHLVALYLRNRHCSFLDEYFVLFFYHLLQTCRASFKWVRDKCIGRDSGNSFVPISYFYRCKAMSITSPSAPYFGISSQSPTASILLAESCMPELSPR